MQIQLSPLQLRQLATATAPKAGRLVRHCLETAELMVELAAARSGAERLCLLRNAARQVELAIVWRDRQAALRGTL